VKKRTGGQKKKGILPPLPGKNFVNSILLPFTDSEDITVAKPVSIITALSLQEITRPEPHVSTQVQWKQLDEPLYFIQRLKSR